MTVALVVARSVQAASTRSLRALKSAYETSGSRWISFLTYKHIHTHAHSGSAILPPPSAHTDTACTPALGCVTAHVGYMHPVHVRWATAHATLVLRGCMLVRIRCLGMCAGLLLMWRLTDAISVMMFSRISTLAASSAATRRDTPSAASATCVCMIALDTFVQ